MAPLSEAAMQEVERKDGLKVHIGEAWATLMVIIFATPLLHIFVTNIVIVESNLFIFLISLSFGLLVPNFRGPVCQDLASPEIREKNERDYRQSQELKKRLTMLMKEITQSPFKTGLLRDEGKPFAVIQAEISEMTEIPFSEKEIDAVIIMMTERAQRVLIIIPNLDQLHADIRKGLEKITSMFQKGTHKEMVLRTFTEDWKARQFRMDTETKYIVEIWTQECRKLFKDRPHIKVAGKWNEEGTLVVATGLKQEGIEITICTKNFLKDVERCVQDTCYT